MIASNNSSSNSSSNLHYNNIKIRIKEIIIKLDIVAKVVFMMNSLTKLKNLVKQI